MDTKDYEQLYARILFNYESKDGHQGREIMYAYNRQVLEGLKIKRDPYDKKSQFIEIGDILELEGQKCKVVNINFKLEPTLYDMSGGGGINIYSPTEPTDFNCQIGVFVERIE
ncbi:MULTISPECIES: hypothetical protein [unclassified Imperialibacter]|uniref:hypothetical protein n=1 Tax=unclassified Imperialibacter TaxID=2629706 RepID=UPI001254DF81|nr:MULTISPECIES: hypothetical protein [unclassified Imperialibacter]CAD5276992.1 conserved hypothetical protein [Imperialibacter sp. 89]CAD5295317.1 conserved hypothetical protein [Imperialibacter sp. 75]VVT29194.1 conserved hypothetical protein [Imperialibacter sp. EC-SDR9]